MLDVVHIMVVLTATASVNTDLAVCSGVGGWTRSERQTTKVGPWNDVGITEWTIKLLGLSNHGSIEPETPCN